MNRRAFLGALLATCPALPALAQTPVRGTLRIYLARHGESTANASRTLAGQTDVALSEQGRQQAKELAATVRGIRFDAVYSSTLMRSRTTAETVAGRGKVQALADLRERNLGRFEGKPNDDPDYLRRSPNDNDDLDGGETRGRFLERVR